VTVAECYIFTDFGFRWLVLTKLTNLNVLYSCEDIVHWKDIIRHFFLKVNGTNFCFSI